MLRVYVEDSKPVTVKRVKPISNGIYTKNRISFSFIFALADLDKGLGDEVLVFAEGLCVLENPPV